MLYRHGFTLMEMIVVLIIIAIAAVVAFPNFSTPTEQARASTVRNNLMAIYTAEKNYRNNNGQFTYSPNIAAINSSLSLSIQDDGIYTYSCGPDVPGTGFACIAYRNGTAAFILASSFPINISGNGTQNPSCVLANSNWCP